MSYNQVKDVLHKVRECHKRLRDAFDQAACETNDQTADWLSEILRMREQNLQTGLARYEKGADQGVLDTWIQFVPDDDLQRALDSIHVKPNMQLEDVWEMGIRFHNALLDLYASLAASNTGPRVTELFQSLHDEEKSIAANQAWDLRQVQ